MKSLDLLGNMKSLDLLGNGDLSLNYLSEHWIERSSLMTERTYRERVRTYWKQSIYGCGIFGVVNQYRLFERSDKLYNEIMCRVANQVPEYQIAEYTKRELINLFKRALVSSNKYLYFSLGEYNLDADVEALKNLYLEEYKLGVSLANIEKPLALNKYKDALKQICINKCKAQDDKLIRKNMCIDLGLPYIAELGILMHYDKEEDLYIRQIVLKDINENVISLNLRQQMILYADIMKFSDELYKIIGI